MKPTTKPRSGQPRDPDGRFIKLGSKVKITDPVQTRRQVVVHTQRQVVEAVGTRAEAAGSGRLVQAVAVPDLQTAADGDEVSGSVSEECVRDSSSGVSESDNEEVGEQEEQQGLGSSLAKEVGGKMADQLFVELPQSVHSSAGRILAGASSLGTSTRSRDGVTLELDGGSLRERPRWLMRGLCCPGFAQRLLK